MVQVPTEDGNTLHQLEERLLSLEQEVAGLKAQLEKQAALDDRVTIICFSGDMDRLMSAFIIATGAAAMQMEASMFFTFWGLTALKKETIFKGKPITEKMMASLIPKGPSHLGTSKLNMLGLGPAFFKHVMKSHNIQMLPDLINLSQELGVERIACQMTMEIMGITRDELIDDISYGGVATFLGSAGNSKVNLFI